MENNIIFAPSKLPLERCSSGLRGTPGKRVYAKSVSRVRIPFSPQEPGTDDAAPLLRGFLSTWTAFCKRCRPESRASAGNSRNYLLRLRAFL